MLARLIWSFEPESRAGVTPRFQPTACWCSLQVLFNLCVAHLPGTAGTWWWRFCSGTVLIASATEQAALDWDLSYERKATNVLLGKEQRKVPDCALLSCSTASGAKAMR